MQTDVVSARMYALVLAQNNCVFEMPLVKYEIVELLFSHLI